MESEDPRKLGNRTILIAVLLTAAFAFPAGFAIARITESPDQPGAAVAAPTVQGTEETTVVVTPSTSGVVDGPEGFAVELSQWCGDPPSVTLTDTSSLDPLVLAVGHYKTCCLPSTGGSLRVLFSEVPVQPFYVDVEEQDPSVSGGLEGRWGPYDRTSVEAGLITLDTSSVSTCDT